ncbi:MAG: 50S ribosomal protein L34 [Candidatus Omnitrophica bacterium]|nr:50S ribosomal protein L34 [Candidatus Omnitrophota bacterium]
MKKHLSTPTRIVARRKHGFRARMSTSGGRNILSARRRKGRRKICTDV